MPRIGRRYALFLKRIDESQDFPIVTGYELRGGHVFPLDGSDGNGGAGLVFGKFKGSDASCFLEDVREAVARSSQASTEGKR